MVIFVLGLPGSGKSYFAKHLANKLGAVYLSSDEIREEIGKRGAYFIAAKTEVYDEMLSRMNAAIKAERKVVLDATFYKKGLRDRFVKQVNNRDVFAAFIQVWASENIIKERTSVKRAKSDADFDVYLQIKAQFEPLDRPHLKLASTNNNIEEMLKEGIDYLKQLKNG